MPRILTVWVVCCAAFAFVGCAQKHAYGYSGAYGKLAWSDEFEEDGVDESKWYAMTGTGPEEGYPEFWGNEEKQFYRGENAFARDGNLVIRAKREESGGMGYTSARMTTNGLYSFTYGRAEARVKLPAGADGLWPALWMLPDGDPDRWRYGAWAASGEIDIMEYRSRLPGEISGAAHFGGEWPANVYKSGTHPFPEGESAEDWHIYALEWFADKLIWYVDGMEYFRLEDWHSNKDGNEYGPPEPYNAPFCLVLNVAVGGRFDEGREPGGNFTAAEMLVDWIRIYQ